MITRDDTRIELPTVDDLLDPISRDYWTAKVAIYVIDKTITPSMAQTFSKLCREIRENTRITEIQKRVEALAKQLKDVLARKSDVSREEIETIFQELQEATKGGLN